MEIDVFKLYNHTISTLNISEEVNIPKDFLNNTDIKDLKDLKLNGFIKNIEENLSLQGTLSGVMVLEDSISLDMYNDDIKDNVQTEDEKKFHDKGFPIYKIEVYK